MRTLVLSFTAACVPAIVACSNGSGTTLSSGTGTGAATGTGSTGNATTSATASTTSTSGTAATTGATTGAGGGVATKRPYPDTSTTIAILADQFPSGLTARAEQFA